MDKMNQLRDLLKHEIDDLYSAEEQIIAALPAMIENAKDRRLSKALKDHLKITEKQRDRLEQVKSELDDGSPDKSFLSGLFGSKKCKAMQGLVREGEKLMGEDMDADVKDAAIVGAAQKIEHYEICGYGTARAYAEELGLTKVEKLLRQTLDEEYAADQLLTAMAVSRLNKEAAPNSKKAKGQGGKKSSFSAAVPAKKRNTRASSKTRKKKTAVKAT